jgi:hypothetical protein
MPRPSKSDWVALILAVLGIAIAVIRPGVGLVWIALWLGTALMLIGSRQRLPRFVPRKAPAVLPNIDPDRVEGAPMPYGAYWMMFPAMLGLCVAPAAMMVDGALLVFAVPCALTLTAFVIMAVVHDRPSATVITRILAARPSERVEGRVEALAGPHVRELTWRTWSGTHHGTTSVESVHGGHVTVPTVTHTTNSCGTREEVRSAFTLATTTHGSLAVDVANLQWAAQPEPVPSGTAPLRKVGTVEHHTMMMFPAVRREREVLREGDRVVMVGPAEEVALGRLQGSPSAPLSFLASSTGDPLEHLRKQAAIRRAFILGQIGCLALIVAMMFIGS